jgi:uncharacterized protein (DUF1330 family)
MEADMFEILVGVNVVDQALFGQYREQMLPLLEAHGGHFVVDVQVAEVLRSPEPQPFNRLFTIRFPSVEAYDAFFADPDYLQVRKRYFEPSVNGTVRLGRYQVQSVVR